MTIGVMLSELEGFTVAARSTVVSRPAPGGMGHPDL